MKRNARKKRALRLLRWVFQRENHLLTCQLERESQQPSYTLSLVPHWDVGQVVTERCDEAIEAFQRHAAVVQQLRSRGWTLAAYSLVR
jgi:hypothetical protein